MRDNPINALRETLRCGFAFRKSRLESLCVLVFGVFVARTVNWPTGNLAPENF